LEQDGERFVTATKKAALFEERLFSFVAREG
jgi:hypothetical protein